MSRISTVSLRTEESLSLFIKDPFDRYKANVKRDGKFGCVKLFFEGGVCPDCCWCAFNPTAGPYIHRQQLFDFFQHCFDYFAEASSPSIRRTFQKQLDFFYHEFVTPAFGPKTRLNRREFWYVADEIRSRYETEMTATAETVDVCRVVWHRKQKLVEHFFVNSGPAKLLFKIFQTERNQDFLSHEEMRNLVYHSILFISREFNPNEVESRDIDQLNVAVTDVMNDIMPGGGKVDRLSFPEFQRAASELQDVYRELREINTKIAAEKSSKHHARHSSEETCSEESVDSSVAYF